MSGIDWSKAPEGFDFHFQAKRKNDVGGFYSASARDRFTSLSGSYILFSDMPDVADIFIVTSRPVIQEWPGVGQPPVGTICGFRDSEDLPWKKVEVRYVSEMTVLLWFENEHGDNEGAYSPEDCQFCTLEQIEAEKRKDTISKMLRYAAITGETFRDVCGKMYDAGLRFEVKP